MVNFKMATCLKHQLLRGTRAPRISRVHQSLAFENCSTRPLGNCRANAFRIAEPTDKSGPEQRKLWTRLWIEPSRKLRSSLRSGGRARPNEDVKLNRGRSYRMLLCLYWFLWQYHFMKVALSLADRFDHAQSCQNKFYATVNFIQTLSSKLTRKHKLTPHYIKYGVK